MIITFKCFSLNFVKNGNIRDENFTHEKCLKYLSFSIKTMKKAGNFAQRKVFAPNIRSGCAMFVFSIYQ